MVEKSLLIGIATLQVAWVGALGYVLYKGVLLLV
jgi:hypothetical protein